MSLRRLVPGTVSEGLNGWSEALTAGLAVKTAKPLRQQLVGQLSLSGWLSGPTAKPSVTGSDFETQRQPLPDS